MPLPTAVEALFARQEQLATRPQLLASGMTRAAIRWRLGEQWQAVLPGVVHAVRVPLTPRQRLIAASLAAGPRSACTGHAAAGWYGLRNVARSERVDVLVPSQSSSRTLAWARISRTAVPFRVREDGAVPLVEPVRAVVDAARMSWGPEQAEALVIEAVQRRLVRLEELVHMNDQLGRRHSRVVARAIDAAASGSWSVPEAGLFRLVASSRTLPEMWCNPDLFASDGRRLLTPDGWFDDVGLAVMVHSRRYHDGPAWTVTVERDGDLVAQGVRVLAVAPRSIEGEPRRVLQRIEQAHEAARRAGGRAPVRAVRRTVL